MTVSTGRSDDGVPSLAVNRVESLAFEIMTMPWFVLGFCTHALIKPGGKLIDCRPRIGMNEPELVVDDPGIPAPGFVHERAPDRVT